MGKSDLCRAERLLTETGIRNPSPLRAFLLLAADNSPSRPRPACKPSSAARDTSFPTPHEPSISL